MIQRIGTLTSLPATDMARAHRFYTEVLGLEAVLGDGPFRVYRAEAPQETMIGLHAHDGPVAAPELQGAWVWLELPSLARAVERLRRHGATLVGEPRWLGPGREQAFLDSEGNVLRLFEPIEEVRRSVVIEAPAARVFEAVTEPAQVARWLRAVEGFALERREGGRVRFTDPVFGEVTGRVTAWEPPRRVAFAFDANWPERLEFTLAPEGSGTRFTVHQTGFAPIADRDFGIPGLVEHLDQVLAALVEVMRLGGIAVGAIHAVEAVADQVRGG